MTTDDAALVRSLLRHAGTTYTAEAGIMLKATPMPLFQLLTMCMLASKPIGAEVAVARGLFPAGLRIPDARRCRWTTTCGSS